MDKPNPHQGYTRSGARCHCLCHRQAGVRHFMACCFPNPPERPLFAADEDTPTTQAPEESQHG
jgi:hypothetical protein